MYVYVHVYLTYLFQIPSILCILSLCFFSFFLYISSPNPQTWTHTLSHCFHLLLILFTHYTIVDCKWKAVLFRCVSQKKKRKNEFSLPFYSELISFLFFQLRQSQTYCTDNECFNESKYKYRQWRRIFEQWEYFPGFLVLVNLCLIT